MIREIVKPQGNTYLLQLPDDMVGKTVEVIAFEIDEQRLTTLPKKTDQELRVELDKVLSRYDKYPKISHKDFKFDRDEANDYE